MPIYEYVCNACRRKFSVLVGVVANAPTPACPRCGGQELTRVVSRFARGRAEEDALEDLADESRFGDIENDPKAMRRWVREMGKALEEDDIEQDLEEALEEDLEREAADEDGEEASEE